MNLVNPKYKQRRLELGVPSIPYQPIFDRVLIFRITEEKYGGDDGVLYKPQSARGADTRGLLVAAGPTALDSLVTHGVLIGDIVWFGQFAGMFEQKSFERAVGEKAKGFVVERVEALNGSEDLIDRVRTDEVSIELDSKGNYMYRFKNAEGVYADGGP